MIFLESPLPFADQRGTVRPIQGCRTLKCFSLAKVMIIRLLTHMKFEYSKDDWEQNHFRHDIFVLFSNSVSIVKLHTF